MSYRLKRLENTPSSPINGKSGGKKKRNRDCAKKRRRFFGDYQVTTKASEDKKTI